MALKSTLAAINSFIDFFDKTVESTVDQERPYPRWTAPSNTDETTFEKEAVDLYKKEISEEKSKQDAEKLVTSSNSYYFLLGFKKANRLYSRSRIEAVAVNKSLEAGLADQKDGFMENKYKKLGDQVGPHAGS